jgi:hypothetical protein
VQQESEILIALDPYAARLLFDALYSLGEHQAAGAAIPIFDSHASETLARILRDLDAAIENRGENNGQSALS